MNGRVAPSEIHEVANLDAPATPEATIAEGRLIWAPVPHSVGYVVFMNGEPFRMTLESSLELPGASTALVEVQVLAVGPSGHESFLSEPLRYGGIEQILEPPAALLESRWSGHDGGGYVPLTIERNRSVTIPVEIDEPGLYAVDVRYANGSGPINSSNRAAIRTLMVDDEIAGVLVMPQRGNDLWTDWGYSSVIQVHLSEGAHTLELRYTPADRNMSLDVNDALLDHVRLTRLE